MQKFNNNFKFIILAVICITIFCFAITPKTFQNDTFYSIAIGKHIVEDNGIDMQDPFSWHKDLPYTYPHWAYDLGTYLIYNMGENIGIGGFSAVYIATIILTIILGIIIFYTIQYLSKSKVISLFTTLGIIYLLKDFIAARAQLVTFILFILTILFIEKFIETGKKRYAIYLIIIPFLIANLHCAVWPFYFVLYLPYLAEYILEILSKSNITYNLGIKYYEIKLRLILKQKNKDKNKEENNDNIKKIEEIKDIIKTLKSEKEKNKELNIKRRNNPYKIIINKEKYSKYLILIMIIASFTGLLTPLGDTPYSYLIKTMEGNTTENISEHQPLVLIENKPILIIFTLFVLILMFTDTKIRLSDLFMLAGLTLLGFMSRRQISMFVLVCGVIFAKLISEIVNKYDKKTEQAIFKFMETFMGSLLTIIIVVLLSNILYKGKAKANFVDEKTYPVEAANYIIENMDIENMRLFNEYNYGSYLLLRGIPVFIDSRADLYAPEFNEMKNKEGKIEGRDIFSDYINVTSLGTYYEDEFKKYDITNVITVKASKLNMFLSKDENYKEIYSDDNFVIYDRLEN